ncbi:hypothetical protein Vi05172_g5119 [Venturia inaequalis]|nr:hypothetical protein Vi05172_g5119 [Venturia inaequalis]
MYSSRRADTYDSRRYRQSRFGKTDGGGGMFIIGQVGRVSAMAALAASIIPQLMRGVVLKGQFRWAFDGAGDNWIDLENQQFVAQCDPVFVLWCAAYLVPILRLGAGKDQTSMLDDTMWISGPA